MDTVTYHVKDDVTFWSQQMTEHALFLYMLLDANKAPYLKQRALDQYQQWVNYLTNPDQTTLLNLLNQLRTLKLDIYGEKSTGKDIGFVYLTLVEHMLKELDFFVTLLNGTNNPTNEINFWKTENAEHTTLTGHLLDPLEKQLTSQTLTLGDNLEITPIGGQLLELIELSNRSALDLYTLLINNKVQALITPAMLAHEIREAERGQQRLTQLLANR